MSPHIPEGELIKRHQALFDLLPEQSALLLIGNETLFRNRDVEYPFRQESSFWYFSRFAEPSAALLFVKTRDEVLSIIFSSEYSREREIWTGKTSGPKEAKRKALTQEAFALEKLPELLEKHARDKTLFFDGHLSHAPVLRAVVAEVISRLRLSPQKAEPLLGKLRLYKSEWEIGEMRKAAEATVRAFQHIEQTIQEAKNERDIEAEILYLYHREGLSPSYPPIVASGENAVTLHYTDNKSAVKEGLLLIDSGAEYNYYASDVTRMFVIGEQMSPEAQLIHETVRRVHKETLAFLKTREISLQKIHEKATELITEALIDLKLIWGTFPECMEREDYKKFFMHGIGHWLGLDVHDLGPSLRESTSPLLVPGMSFTIEPGLYFNKNDHTIPEEFRGIGVRIEDDVVITESGPEILTNTLPW